MKILGMLLSVLLLQACGNKPDCADLVGTWKGNSLTLMIDREGSGMTLKLANSPKKLYMQCKDGALSGDQNPIRGSINGDGKLVLDGFPGGAMEVFAKQ